MADARVREIDDRATKAAAERAKMEVLPAGVAKGINIVDVSVIRRRRETVVAVVVADPVVI